MPFFDLPLEQLQTYRPQVAKPADLEQFWQRTLDQNPFDATAVTRTPVPTALQTVTVEDVTFGGYGQAPIRAWLITPHQRRADGACVVQFVGYGGGRGLPEEHLLWPSAGYTFLIMDTRGQGGQWGSGGDTADPEGAGPATPGMMTSGIQSPYTYYYRRVFTDAHHAVEVASLLAQPGAPIYTTGSSQGGALALAAASLNSRVDAVMADVPFLCNFKRCIGFAATGPYLDVVKFLSVNRDCAQQVWDTLAYFDLVNLVPWARARALFSTGLMDTTCPPSSVFSAKNWYGGQAEIEVYPYNAHEGGATYQLRRQLEWAGQ